MTQKVSTSVIQNEQQRVACCVCHASQMRLYSLLAMPSQPPPPAPAPWLLLLLPGCLLG